MGWRLALDLRQDRIEPGVMPHGTASTTPPGIQPEFRSRGLDSSGVRADHCTDPVCDDDRLPTLGALIPVKGVV